jgi:hypothetical protein
VAARLRAPQRKGAEASLKAAPAQNVGRFTSGSVPVQAMNGTSLGSFLVAGGFLVFLVVGMVEALPLFAGFVGGILCLIGLLQVRKDADRFGKPHKTLVTAALVLMLVVSILSRILIRSDFEGMDADALRVTLILQVVNDTILTAIPLLGLALVTNILERILMGAAVVATLAFGVVSVGAFDALLAGTGTRDDFLLWLNLSLWLGNIPVVAAAAMCGARRSKDAPAPAAQVGQSATLSCPRCRTTVARPAAGAAVCPTCSYPGADSRAGAAGAPPAR